MFLIARRLLPATWRTRGWARASLVTLLVAVWAVRLAAYITWRNWGEGEDARYQAIRARNEPGFAFKSLYLVFALQGVIAWIVALPLLAAIHSTAPLNLIDYLGVGLWMIGMVFEAVGDWQLARFKADPPIAGGSWTPACGVSRAIRITLATPVSGGAFPAGGGRRRLVELDLAGTDDLPAAEGVGGRPARTGHHRAQAGLPGLHPTNQCVYSGIAPGPAKPGS